MSEWQPIGTAAKYKAGRYNPEIVKIDILAKVWLRATDKFEYRRFTDCYWRDADTFGSSKEGWPGVDEEYLPVAWIPIPTIPESYP